MPPPLRGVEIVEHPGAALPGDVPFLDDRGRQVTLRSYGAGGRPMVLALVYYRCPMLCTKVLSGLVTSLREVGLDPASDFEVVAVSIDPQETPAAASAKKRVHLEALGRPDADPRWHFLTGSPAAIARVADAVGFRYRYDPDRNEYAHQAAIYVATPDGRLSRYLYGIEVPPRTLRLALVEASEGRVGSSMDRVFLACYHWDASTGTYAPDAMKLMRMGAGVSVLLLAGLLAALWRRDVRRHRTA